MANIRSLDLDDDFNNIYKKYTGPFQHLLLLHKRKQRAVNGLMKVLTKKVEPHDPDVVLTDFTGPEEKLREAKF